MTKATYRRVYLGLCSRGLGSVLEKKHGYTCRLEQDAVSLHTEPQAGILENKLRMMHTFEIQVTHFLLQGHIS